MTTNEHIGSAVRAARGSESQAALASRMQRRGHKWSQATVWAVETGERPLRALELSDLSDVLNVTVEYLLSPPRTTRVEVYEHLVMFDRTPQVSACGKVWTSIPDAISVGRCPECTAISEGWWRK